MNDLDKNEKGGSNPKMGEGGGEGRGGMGQVSWSRYESHAKEHIETHVSSYFRPSVPIGTV